MTTQFKKLSMNQSLTQLNTVQQTLGWCKIIRNNGDIVVLCGANPESVNFIGNAHTLSYVNPYNQKW